MHTVVKVYIEKWWPHPDLNHYVVTKLATVRLTVRRDLYEGYVNQRFFGFAKVVFKCALKVYV